jgi:hypothetical protein
VKVTALSKRHHPLGQGTKTLCFRLSCFNPSVSEKSCSKVRQKQSLVGGTTAEAGAFRWLGHGGVSLL